MVNRALARLGVQKLTGFAEDRIRLSAQNSFALPGGRKFSFGGFKINAKVISQPLDVPLGDLNPFVNRTAISRTL